MGRIKEIQSKVNKAKNNSGNNRKRRSLIRIKMPNFDAIHKKRFKEMESILDHVERKAERAKELSKSTVKKSIKKEPTNVNTPTEEMANNMNEKIESKILKGRNDGIPPKARQKINFNNDNKITKIKNNESFLQKSKIKSNIITPASNKNKKIDSNVSRQKPVKKMLVNENEQPKTNNKPEKLEGTKILENNKKTEYVKKVRVNRTFELKMAHRNNKK